MTPYAELRQAGAVLRCRATTLAERQAARGRLALAVIDPVAIEARFGIDAQEADRLAAAAPSPEAALSAEMLREDLVNVRHALAAALLAGGPDGERAETLRALLARLRP